MTEFQFELEPVLRQRRTAEDRRQRELAEVLSRRMALEQQQESMQERISSSRYELRDRLKGRVDVDRVIDFARWSGVVSQRIQQLRPAIVMAEEEITVARQKLLEASRARKALELLRDKRYELWRRRRQQREDSQLDELAMQSYVRSESYLCHSVSETKRC